MGEVLVNQGHPRNGQFPRAPRTAAPQRSQKAECRGVIEIHSDTMIIPFAQGMTTEHLPNPHDVRITGLPDGGIQGKSGPFFQP